MGTLKVSADKTSGSASAAHAHASRQPFFPRVQTKLTVNRPGDSFEQEADKTAERVMRMPASASAEAPVHKHADHVQRREEEKILRAHTAEHIQRREEEKIFRSASSDDLLTETLRPHRAEEQILRSGDGAPAIRDDVHSAIRGSMTGGEPLGADVRGFMEPRFNADFGGVRVHRDTEASHLSNQLSARAFTYQNHIFFSRNQYQPDTSGGKRLLAHELTHTIQQGKSIQRAPDVSTSGTTPAVQRLGVQDALDKFADWANVIPGFRLLTLVIGVNPINLRTADRSAANILRALIELIPGGVFITQALDNHGIVTKVAAWVQGKLGELGDIGGGLSAALRAFLDTLSWSDIFNLDGVWARARHIFSEPADRLIQFALSTAVELLRMVKDAILKPLAALAQGTRGCDLLCVLLGADPISGEPVPRSAENLIGGFMKLIGQEEVWENIKKGNAIARAYAWFQNALGSLVGMVHAVPQKIATTLAALNFQDIVTVAGALGKIVGTFVNIAVDFIAWGLSTVWELLKIVIDVVKPGLMGYLQRTGAALKSIVKNPMPFLGNLVKAAKLGFTNFADRIGEHLKTGIIDWLTGSLEGVYIPKAVSLAELGKFALSVLGITWAQVRGKIVAALGPNGEKIMQGFELAFDVVKALVTGGIAAVWDLIRQKLSDLKDQVIEGIISFVTDTIVKKAIPKLIGMFIPGAGFIPAIISIYDTIMVFVEKINKIIAVVTAFIDSIVNIAAGNIGPAAKRVESTLANLLSLAISFLAGFLGLGKVTDKIMEVVKKVRAKVDAAIGAAVNWVVGKAKALFGKLFDKKHQPEDEKWKAGVAGVKADLAELEKNGATSEQLDQALPGLKRKYEFASLRLEPNNQGWQVKGSMSPERVVDNVPSLGSETDPFDLNWPKPASTGYRTLYFGGATSQATTQDEMKNKVGEMFEGAPVRAYEPTSSTTLPGGEKVGLTENLAVDTVIGPLSSAKTPGGGRINRIFRKYGFRAGKEGLDGDHVQEIQFGGQDAIGNLWPLSSGINRGAGSSLAQASVTHPKAPSKTFKIRDLKADNAHKYYFRIKSTLSSDK